MSKTGIIIAVVLLLLAIAGLLLYFFVFSENAQKKKLIDQIMEKGKTIPRFDGDREQLMKKTIVELKQILVDVTGLAKG